MPKIKQMQVGKVFVKETSSGRWRASWTDPLTKRHIRRMLPCSSHTEARLQAEDINANLAQGMGFAGRQRGVSGHEVHEAVLEAVKHSNANERTRKDYLGRFNAFADYLNRFAKGVVGWGDVTAGIIGNYIQHCREEGVSHDTLRMRIFVLRMTSDYMSRTYPDLYRHITTSIRLKRTDPPKAELERSESILKPEQFRVLLAYLREHEPMVYVWACLQGLCGLRQLEAGYLRERDFDPEASTVCITENSAHKPKNRPSYRMIPVCGTVAKAIGDWINCLKIRHAEGFLFAPANPSGNRHGKSKEARAGVFTRHTISHEWRRALDAARADGIELPRAFVPRKLRASFVTAMRTADADFGLLQAYIGHAATSVLQAHYDHLDLERLRRVSDLAQTLADGCSPYAEKGDTRSSERVLAGIGKSS